MKNKILEKLLYINKYLYIFISKKYPEMMQSNSSDNCADQYNFKILNLFDLELQLINIKPMIKRS